jgi:ribosome-associated toxin RatA of RatAB toxin-antitoxin module
MERIEKSIEVHCPVRTVYNQWTQFEDFPKFMAGVKEVRQLDDTHVHWHAEVWGKDKEWDAEITEQVPDERISWKSTSGATNSGTVRFESLGPDVTRVRLVMAYDPEGAIENIGDAVGLMSARVQESVEDFKEFIEERSAETGGWRGEVHGGQAEKRTNVGTADSWAGAAGDPPGTGGSQVPDPSQASRRGAANDSGSKLEISKQPAPGPGKQAREQWQLDQSIEESFPASDPISPAQPGNKPKK